ncbi:hypothetical protein [Hymenobacter persicinus]|uniref:Uncharacterized protein n=1 Tax=Hymenobacter persicinus TaxID=2025506 RepID=A0A4Q5L9N4_9BACT|nr:hypothetical protein [Hymenobacter persicinus]RYU77206.1 hypothetical protein EWM57_17715 [Hymenobacter persicinus]
MEPVSPKPTNHILRNNLLGVLAAAVVLGALVPSTRGGSAIPFAMVYGLQVVVNLALGVFRLVSSKPGASAAPYFLSALLVLIIGFGACSVMILGGLSTMN